MNRLLSISCALLLFAAVAQAQTQQLPPDLAGLPDEIKTLKWQSVETGSAPILEQCRALLLLNHTLDELCANVTAEADLMSSYIEKNNLGAEFAKTPPPPTPAELSYGDAQKVAVALLRGPMRTSYYATELGDLDPGTLLSYQQMYSRTCQRRWSEFEESRHLVRAMTSYLGNSQKLQDYDAWATAESARREAEHQQQNAQAKKDAGEQQKMEVQLRQQQAELMQMQAALAAAHSQQQAAPAQQASSVQGGQTQTPAGQPAQAVNGGYVVDGSPYAYGYGGYGGYGYGVTPAGAAAAGAYAGANAANNQDKNAAAAGAAGAAAANNNKNEAGKAAAGSQYHAANSSWNRDSSYHGQAQAQTQQRMSSFHGGGGSRGGGGRR